MMCRRKPSLRRAVIDTLEARCLLSSIPTPTIPSRVFNIESYGAVATSANNTTDIQAAISAAAAAGGGIVEIPAASQDWECGPLTLSSNIDFQVDAGATLQMLAYGTYPLANGATSYANFIEGNDLSNVEISGGGTIDGNGSPWWTAYTNGTLTVTRPQMIAINNSDIVLIEGLTLQNPPNTHISIQNASNDVTVQNITINTPASSPNTDGIDVSGTNMIFRNDSISDGDDNIAMGAGATSGGPETANITIIDCFFGVGHGLSIGSYTSGGVDNVTVADCTFNGTTSGIRMKSERGRGGLVENISYYNITMTNVEYAIDINSYYEAAVPSTPMDPYQTPTSTTPYWENITISNLVSVTSSSQSNYSGSYCGIIWGLPEAPVSGVTLSNVQLTARYGFDLDHDTNVAFDAACRITPLGGGSEEMSDTSAPTPYEVTVEQEGYSDEDVGAPATAGDTLYNPDAALLTDTAGGTGIGGTSDQFNFLSETATGNITYFADLTSNSSSSSTDGVMIRDSSNTASSAFADAVVTSASVQFQYRSANGGTVSTDSVSGVTGPWLEVVRNGSTFSGYYSTNGTNWTLIGSASVTMSSTEMVGLAVAANSSTATTTAQFASLAGPSITTEPLASPQPATGTTANLSVSASESGSTLTYTWSILESPSGVTAPTFSTNGTSTSNNTTVTFFGAGIYEFLVTVTDSNNDARYAVVGVGVNQTPTTVTVKPASTDVLVNTSSVFTATATDQFGVTFEPNFAWSLVSGGGTQDSSAGVFTSTATAGSATIGATAGSASNTASITIVPVFAVESGSTLEVTLNPTGTVTLSTAGSSVTASEDGILKGFTGVTAITVTDSGTADTLNFNGPLADPFTFGNAGTSTVNVNTGTLNFAAASSIALGTLNIASGALAAVPVNSSSQTQLLLSGLSITSGTLDLSDNELLITYGSDSDPMAAIYTYIQSGYNNGGWNGPGIISTSARTPTNGLTYALGFADGKDGIVSGLSSGQIEVKYTLLGDANLDGTVNGTDFSILAGNFGLGVTNWDQGNFLFSSSVNGSDFSALSANFGQGVTLPAAAIVEAPATGVIPASTSSTTDTTSDNSVSTTILKKSRRTRISRAITEIIVSSMKIIGCVIWVLAIGPASLLAQSALTQPPLVAKPVIPDRRFTILAYGAIGDGIAKNTLAITRTIAACQAAGGGTVEIPPGRFLTGPFSLISNLNLHLDAGATLVFSNHPADYKITSHLFQNCIQATQCHDLAITGPGTIEGQGEFWWKNFVRPKTAPADFPMPRRPFMVVLSQCRRVWVQGITLQNSPNFHLVPAGCDDLTIDAVRIKAPAKSPNTDGIDLTAHNCVITNCTIDVGDDNLVLKPGSSGDSTEPACENIWVSGCKFLHGHGMSIGGQSHGGVRNLTVRDCTFEDTDAGIRMKSARGVGGLVQNLTYENLRMNGVKIAVFITSYYPEIPANPATMPSLPVNKQTPIWRNILIRNLTSINGDTAGRIIGLAEMPISGIVFENVSLAAERPMQIVWANDIHFYDSRITCPKQPVISISHGQVFGIDPSTGR